MPRWTATRLTRARDARHYDRGSLMNLNTRILVGITLLAGGCVPGEHSLSPRPTAVRSERDRYAASARAHPSALRAWEEASRRALRSAGVIAPSHSERLIFRDGRAEAAAYRISLVRGQSIRVSVTSARGDPAVFTDMFHHAAGEMFRPVHWDRQSNGSSTFIARSHGEYILRVQPRIGAGGVYDLAVMSDVSLIFPVAGAWAIGGVFGDPRDDGARTHEGVDIFAPRGTPVVAVADGVIEQARNTPTGGLVIWQADASSSLTYYYAHLDELLVQEGTYARAGDVIGTVGTSGNARGTRPHLHFAVYRPGRIPLDPAPLLGTRQASH